MSQYQKRGYRRCERYRSTYILEIAHLGRIKIVIGWMMWNLFKNIGCTPCKVKKAALDIAIQDCLLTLLAESISYPQPIFDASARR